MRVHHLLALALVGAAAAPSPALAAFPGENGKILFDSDREGSDIDIWTMRTDGTRLVNLTPDGINPIGAPGETEYFDGLATWSPDGRRIAFLSDRPLATNTEGDSEIFVMNADGSHQRQLTFNALTDGFPAWSADGRAIVFSRDLDPMRGDDEFDDDVFVMDADGRQQRNLTNSPGVDEFEPVASPDGKLIAFASDRGGDNEIYTMDAKGRHIRQLTNNSRNDEFPDWSPDGRLIAFEAGPLGTPDIFTMRADGSRQTRLTSDPAPEGLPVWSPDGRFIAFARDFDIITMRADGGGQVNRTANDAFDIAPDWQPLR